MIHAPELFARDIASADAGATEPSVGLRRGRVGVAAVDDFERFSALVSHIYELTGEQLRWSELLAGVADFVGARVAQLAVFSVDEEVRPSWAVAGCPRELYRNFIYRHAQEDLRLPYILGNPGRVICAEDGVDPDAFRRTAFFREMVEPMDLEFSLVSQFARERNMMATLAVMRGRESGPFTEQERSRFALLMPHFRRAFELFALLQKARAQVDDIGAALDLVDAAVFLADGDLTIAHANRAGRDMVSPGRSVTIRNGRLACRDAQATRKIVLAARHALDPRLHDSADHIAIPQGPDERPLQASLHPLAHGDIRASLAPLAGLAIVIRRPERAPRVDAGRLMQAFHFTHAEAALAASLAAGGSLHAYARDRGVALSTVRTQLRSLFAKTETGRQGALVATLRQNLDVSLM